MPVFILNYCYDDVDPLLLRRSGSRMYAVSLYDDDDFWEERFARRDDSKTRLLFGLNSLPVSPGRKYLLSIPQLVTAVQFLDSSRYFLQIVSVFLFVTRTREESHSPIRGYLFQL